MLILKHYQQKVLFAWGVVDAEVRSAIMLSNEIAWVKLFPHDSPEAKTMKKLILVLFLTFSCNAQTSDCFDLAGRDYRIDPDLLRAIAWHESKLTPGIIGKNPVVGFGSGEMQIDSQHFPELANYGITPEQLLSDSCLNIYTGAYYLAIAFKKWGVNWQAVGAYNAGFKKSDLQNERRLNYAKSIEQYYKAIKNSKTMHQLK